MVLLGDKPAAAFAFKKYSLISMKEQAFKFY
jgi:hypothetical protein